MKRLLSGIKPTGDIHLGNYFGVMNQYLKYQDNHESFIFIANLHALNQIHDAEVMRINTLNVAKAYLAIGLDPEKVCLFKQSDVPAVSELCWIFNSITSMGMLERAHAYKDFVSKNSGDSGSLNVGVFDYPVLMAADILMYQSDVVPVGKDQQQHLEMAVDIGQRFNHIFGDTFKLPEALIEESSAAVVGIDGRKMSKSYDNVIGLFDSDTVLQKKVMSIKTDSLRPDEPKNPDECNVFAWHKLVASEPELDELRELYEAGRIGYKESKDRLLVELERFLQPIQARKAELDDDEVYVNLVLEKGALRANEEANKTLKLVKEKVGLL